MGTLSFVYLWARNQNWSKDLRFMVHLRSWPRQFEASHYNDDEAQELNGMNEVFTNE